MNESRQLRRLTSLRWFAALAVFLNHFGNKMIWTAQIIPTLGFAGVDLFFVLSGVVLTWSAPTEDTASRFCLRRFARIYPAAMAAGLIAVLLAFALGRSIHPGLTSAVAFVLLIQAWWPGRMWAAYNGVEWTLSCEAFFYVLFPWLRRSAARIPQRQLTAIAVGFALVTLVVADAVPGTIALHDPALRLSEFVAGVTVGMGLRRGWVPRISVLAAALAYAVLVVGASMTRVPWLVPLPGAALLLAASAGADLRGEPTWLSSRWPVYLGEVSFSFYLVHEPLMSYLNAVGVRGWWLVVALPAGLVVAITVHHGIELPMRRRIMRASFRRETDQRPIGAGIARSL